MRLMQKLALCAVVWAGLWWPLVAWADRPLRLVVAFPAGGAMDTMARALAAEWAPTASGRPVVENRPGADGLIALNHVLTQSDRGSTLLMVGPYFTTAWANGKLAADNVARFQPVVHLGDLDIHLIAHHRLPLKHRADLARPVDKPWTCAASGGQFTTVCELLARDYPGRVLPVPYRGEAQALNDVLGGHVDFMPVTALFAAQHVAAGTLTLVADLSAPSLGGVAESVVFGGAIKSFYGFVATRDMPPALVNQLNRDINRLIKSQALDAGARALGVRLTGGGPDVLAAVLRENAAVQSRLLGGAR